jgi:glycosyltransferase involved in cell wall biosynthesis
MRIAQIAQLWHSVPPNKYGGVERAVSYLTEELVKLGHEVTLYATGDSRTQATLEAIWPVGLREADIVCKEAPIFTLLKRVTDSADEFDILHSHLDWFGLPLVDLVPRPVLSTIHGWMDLPELKPLFRAYPHAPLISISHAQRAPLSGANWETTIYHGLPRDLYSFSGNPGRHLVFLGRISHDNGADLAIHVALAADRPLYLGGPVHEHDRGYFEACIRPHLSHPLIAYPGELNDGEKYELLKDALALVWPFIWPQAFGLGAVEAYL